jgi:hypothetical protein
MRKPEAFFTFDKDGMIAEHCKDKLDAFNAFHKCMFDWEVDGKFDPNEIEEGRVFICNRQSCGGIKTYGENICIECSEPLSPIGRRAFYVDFTKFGNE